MSLSDMIIHMLDRGFWIEKKNVKEAVKELKEWLELHQDTLITGGTIWEVIKDKFGLKLCGDGK